MHAVFWWRYLAERYHLEELRIDKIIILEWIYIFRQDMDGTNLAQVGYKWRALVNAVLELRVT